MYCQLIAILPIAKLRVKFQLVDHSTDDRIIRIVKFFIIKCSRLTATHAFPEGVFPVGVALGGFQCRPTSHGQWKLTKSHSAPSCNCFEIHTDMIGEVCLGLEVGDGGLEDYSVVFEVNSLDPLHVHAAKLRRRTLLGIFL